VSESRVPAAFKGALEHLSNVCARTGMFVHPDTYQSFCAYVQGYDAATSYSLLRGFREWLVLRLRDGSNLAWTALVKDVISARGHQGASDIQERAAIEQLFELIRDFIAERGDDVEAASIFSRYAEWERKRSAEWEESQE
jgi:hypothetical protein